MKSILKKKTIILFITFIIADLLLSLCAYNYYDIKTYVGETVRKIYLSTVDVSGMEISAILLDEDKNQYTSYEWNATDYDDIRTLTYQINYKKNNLSASYNSGDLEIVVDNLITDFVNLSSLKSESQFRANINKYIIVSADNNSNHSFDWSYKYSSDYSKIILTNNNDINSNINFEGSIQITYVLPEYDLKSGVESTIKSTLNNSKESNGITLIFNSKKGTVVFNKESLSSPSYYDAFPSGDYTWIYYSVSTTNTDSARILTDLYCNISSTYDIKIISTNYKEVEPNTNVNLTAGVRTVKEGLISIAGSTTSILDRRISFYVGFPNNGDENVSFSIDFYSRYRYAGIDKTEPLILLESKEQNINLSDYSLTDTELKYSMVNYSASRIDYDVLTESIPVNNMIGGIRLYNKGRKKVDIKLGFDYLYVKKKDGSIHYLSDTEYCYDSIMYPYNIQKSNHSVYGAFKNGNSQTVENGLYNVDLYVRYENEEEYILYDSFLNNGKVFSNFPKNVVAYYFVLHDYDMSLSDYYLQSLVKINDPSIISIQDSIYYSCIAEVYEGDNLISPITNWTPNPLPTHDEEYDLKYYGHNMNRKVQYANIQSEDFNINSKISMDRFEIHSNQLYKSSVTVYESVVDNFTKRYYYGYDSYILLPEGLYTDNVDIKKMGLDYEYLYVEDYNLPFDSVFLLKSGKLYSYSDFKQYIIDHTNIEITNNWNNSNRQLIHINLDFNDDPFDFKNFIIWDNYSPWVKSFSTFINFDVFIDNEAILEYGNTKQIDIYTYANNYSLSYHQDINGNMYKVDINDYDNDNNVDEYVYYSNKSQTIATASESSQNLKTSAKTDKDNYGEEVNVSLNNQYTYKLRARSGANKITNMVIYDSLEKYIKRDSNYDLAAGKNNYFQGTFQGVDTSFAESQGYTVKVYYSENDKPGSLSSDTSWKIYTSSVDKSKVKSLAFEYLDGAGGKATLPEDTLTYVEVIMKSPSSITDTKYRTYNGSWVEWNALDSTNNIIPDVVGINSNVATVSLPATLKVKHLEEGTDKVLADEEITENLLFGKTYTTSASTNLPVNYEFSKTSGDDPNGTISKGITEVIYYYKKVVPTTTKSCTATATTAIDKRTDKVTYNITCNYSIENWIGDYAHAEILELPYEIDKTKSVLDGGVYEDTKNTIAWFIEEDSLSTDKHEYTAEYTIDVYYKDIPISERNINTTFMYVDAYADGDPKEYIGSEDDIVEVPLITAINEKYKITVKHLEDGTNNVIAPEETYYKYYNEDYEYGISSELPGNYQLKTRPDNYKGKVLAEETVITYLYEKKTPITNYTCTATATPIIDNRTDKVTYHVTCTYVVKDFIGTYEHGEGFHLPYTINKSESNIAGAVYNSASKTITWASNKTIESADPFEFEVEHTIEVVYSSIPISDRSITASYLSLVLNENEIHEENTINENLTTQINEKHKITVKHLEDGTNNVVAPEETYYKYYNEDYEYGESSELPGNYKLKTRPDNYKGKVLAEETVITYLYEKKTPELNIELSIDGTNDIDNRTNLVTYNLSGKSTTKDYIGSETIKEVFELPYEIDLTKSNLDGGTYNSSAKTITWTTTHNVTTADSTSVDLYHEITVVYKNIPISVGSIKGIYTVTNTTELNNKTVDTDVTTNINEKYKITVKHLEYGTNNEIAPEDTYYKLYNESYEVGESSSIPGNYQLKTRPTNYKGTVLAEETVVTYLYEKKNPNLTSTVDITGTSQIDKRTKEIIYNFSSATTVKDFIGTGSIVDVIKLPYEVNPAKSNLDGGTYDNSTKTITWTTPYETTNANVNNFSTSHEISIVYLDIPIDVLNISSTYTNTISNDLGTMSSSKETSTDIKEKYRLVVHHVEYGTSKVLADDEEFEKYYNESYEVGISSKLPGNYQLKKLPDNYKGTIKAEKTDVIFVYEKKTPILTGNVNITGPESVEDRFDSINYTITSNGSVKDLIGEYSNSIVVELPYEIDESKSNLNGGTYNSSNKTITWNNPGSTTTIDKKDLSYEYNISIVYKDVPISAKTYNTKVTSTLRAEEESIINESLLNINVLEKYKLVVKHLEYGTNKVLATQEEYFRLYGDSYETTASSEVTDNYALKITPNNYKGTIKSEITEVIYYYEMIESDLTTNIDVECPEVISKVDEEVNIKITYKFTSTNYLGPSKVTISNVLPYEIIPEKSDLDGGEYDSSTKTITWVINDTIENLESTEKEYTKGIKVIFKDIVVNEPIVNNISGSIVLDNNSNVKETSGITDVKIYGNIIIKYIDIDTNETISEDTIVNDLVGALYTPISKNIEDYNLVSTLDNSYTVSLEDQILTYKYKKRVKEVVQEQIPKVDENPSTGLFKTYYLLSIPIILLIMVVIRIGKHSMFKKYS